MEDTYITDAFGTKLKIGDEVIIMTKYDYLIKGQICAVNRSIQYYHYDKVSQRYDTTNKGWLLLFTSGQMSNIYKV